MPQHTASIRQPLWENRTRGRDAGYQCTCMPPAACCGLRLGSGRGPAGTCSAPPPHLPSITPPLSAVCKPARAVLSRESRIISLLGPCRPSPYHPMWMVPVCMSRGVIMVKRYGIVGEYCTLWLQALGEARNADMLISNLGVPWLPQISASSASA